MSHSSHPSSARVLLFFAAFLASATAWGDYVAEGRKIPWSATIPVGWLGGTPEKIAKVLGHATKDYASETLKAILRPMLPEAKELDSLFHHRGDTFGTEIKAVSSLAINVTDTDITSFTDKTERTSFWNAYAKQLEKDFPAGATVEMTDDRSGTTDGRKAYRAIFVTTLPREKVHTALHLVAYAPGKTHVFRLRANSRDFPERVAELDKILESLKYR